MRSGNVVRCVLLHQNHGIEILAPTYEFTTDDLQIINDIGTEIIEDTTDEDDIIEYCQLFTSFENNLHGTLYIPWSFQKPAIGEIVKDVLRKEQVGRVIINRRDVFQVLMEFILVRYQLGNTQGYIVSPILFQGLLENNKCWKEESMCDNQMLIYNGKSLKNEGQTENFKDGKKSCLNIWTESTSVGNPFTVFQILKHNYTHNSAQRERNPMESLVGISSQK